MIKFIWIIGNIGTGKTTTCRELKKEFSMPHFNIDDYRVRLNPHCTKLGEVQAIDAFYNDLEKSSLVLLESIGTYGEVPYFKFGPKHSVLVKLSCSKEVSLKRVEERINDKTRVKTPFPYLNECDNELDSYKTTWEWWENKASYDFDLTFDTSKVTTEEIINEIKKKVDMKNKESIPELQKKLDQNNEVIYQEYKKVSDLRDKIASLMNDARNLERHIANLKDENEDLLADIRKAKG